MLPQDRSNNLVPVKDFASFAGSDELREIQRLITLPPRTCTHRAASEYAAVHLRLGRRIPLESADTFEQAILKVREDPHAMMLVPELHAVQRRLAQKAHFEELRTQGFTLPNPSLFIAEPERNLSVRTYLWCLPTLLPLVREKYPDGLPFEEVVPARTTQDAAEHCGKIFGGGFCVTNEQGLSTFLLKPLLELRHIVMRWYLYCKRQD